MSIAANPIARMPIGADPTDSPAKKTPPKRTVTPSADAVLRPEPR